MAHLSQWKREMINDLVNRFTNSNVVGIAKIEGIPSLQLQLMRKKLRGKVDLIVSKNNLINLALKEASSQKKGLEKLGEVIEGQTAIITANINPFRLFKEMEATKTKAPARGGEIAPEDIIIKAGETPFKPGPVVGELQKVGIPASIEKGKVLIRKEKLLVKKGERISREVAQVLSRLEIHPLTVGLDLRGAFEDGLVFKRDILAVDETSILNDLRKASSQAFSLAMQMSYPTRRTIRPLISKAYEGAFNLGVNASIPTSKTIKVLLQNASYHMLSLACKVPDAIDEDLKKIVSRHPSKLQKEEKKEKKKEEEKSEEEAASGLGSLFK